MLRFATNRVLQVPVRRYGVRFASSTGINSRHSKEHHTIYDYISNDDLNLDNIPLEHIRNFSVIAHVDHGKSTLSDAILQLTGNINDEDKKRGQVMDTLKVERERGITVKAQTASMIFHDDRTGIDYLLNLIDTPGHIDFSYEVSRSLASCQGALLLVDSSQSIQAQTLATYSKAIELGLVIVPAVTKIDLPGAMPIDVALNMGTTFDLDPSDVIQTSAKANIGVLEVLEAIIDCVPSPPTDLRSLLSTGKDAATSTLIKSITIDSSINENKKEIKTETETDAVIDTEANANANAITTTTVRDVSDIYTKDEESRFCGRIVDSWYDEHRGVICLVQVVSGTLKEGQRMSTYASVEETKDIDARTEFSVQDVGFLTPLTLRTKTLRKGQVGYVIAGLRSTRQARMGDTMFLPSEWGSMRDARNKIIPLSGYEAAKPMLFASVFPVNTLELEQLFAAVDRLVLNDSSIHVTKDQSNSLGAGLRCGFLGFLHMEVFNQRLSDEFNIQIVMTTPSVPYIIETKKYVNKALLQQGIEPEMTRTEISSVADWPINHQDLKHTIYEPVVMVTLVSPAEYYGAMVELLKIRRSSDLDVNYLDDGSVLLKAKVPWQEVVCDMNDAVKNASSGYASFNYEEAGYIQSDLCKVEIAVNGDPCDPLSFVCHTENAQTAGRKMASKLKDVIQRQNFEIILQAKVGGKILARERIAPYRKDVLTKGSKTVGGGDITRKKKLLEKQKAGKKRAKMVGKVEIGQDAFWSVLQQR
jgi:elongation factor 4